MEEKKIAMPPLEEAPLEEEGVAEQEQQEEPTQPTEQQEEPAEQVQPESPDVATKSQGHFKVLREKTERLEAENAEAQKKLRAYEDLYKKSNAAKDEEDLEIHLSDDDLFEGRHFKKLQKQLEKQQRSLDEYQNQIKLTSTEAKLKSQFNDFDSVVSAENVKRLRELEPELSESIASTQDIYSKAVSAYKMIKKLGIYVEDKFENDREIARKNSLKPKPLASVSPQQGESPLTRANAFANGLTPELQKQLWKEMEEASKGY